MKRKLDFKISTGLKNIIGKELITDDHIAIFELVKNSYDADAKNVKIIFQNMRTRINKSKIIIMDDGLGMSYNDLVNKWLFVGYSEKKDTKKTDNFRNKTNLKKRVFAGAKGIGRFSADRLGSKLRMYTKTLDDDNMHFIDLDWNKFEDDQEKKFQMVQVDYDSVNSADFDSDKQFEHGTVIEISSLSSDWPDTKILKLRRYLQRLVNPNQLNTEDTFRIEIIADEFLEDDHGKPLYEKINGVVDNVVFEKLKIKTVELSSRIIDGKITTTLTDKGTFIFTIEEKNIYKKLNNLSTKVFFLNKNAKSEFSKTMGMAPIRFGSIFLYKNGFRIHPYGDEGDDWLRLEQRKGQGQRRYLSTRDIMGRVELEGVQPEFNEVSSRGGGVINSDGYGELKQFFVEKTLRRIERYVIEGIEWDKPLEDRKKSDDEIMKSSLEIVSKLIGQVKDPHKQITYNHDLLSIYKIKQVENLPNVAKSLDAIIPYVPKKEQDYVKSQLKKITNITKNYTHEIQTATRDKEVAETEALFLKKTLSTDAEMIQDFNHTITNATKSIATDIKTLIHLLKTRASLDKIMECVEKISIENYKARSLSSIISNANFTLKTKTIKGDIPSYIRQYIHYVLSGTSGTMKFGFNGVDVTFETKFVPLALSMILDNLVTNARKARATKVTFQFEVTGHQLYVYVGDNGRGIPPENQKNVFRRGFTTSSGSGIGLSHIQTAMIDIGGNITFIGNNHLDLGCGACFRLVFP